MKPELIFQSSSLYLLVCLLAGLAYAFLLYQKTSSLRKNERIGLAVLRALLVSFICFLLLNPLVKTFNTLIIRPKVVLAIDNSASMAFQGKKKTDKLLDELSQLIVNIRKKGLDVDVRDLSNDGLREDNLKENMSFNLRQTNLSQLFSGIRTTYEGQNLSDVVLVSDGIINKGVSPNFQHYNFRVHTIAFGDSTRHKDIAIEGITANKLAYLGNKFKIRADISAQRMAGRSTVVNIKNDKGEVESRQMLQIPDNASFQTLEFELSARQTGKQLYTIEVAPAEGEFSAKNNYRQVLIDVVDGREKILLVALSPHPDIKAIRSIIEKNDLFDLEIRILQSDDISSIAKETFDLLILHQLPDVYGSSTALVSALLSRQKPVFFILGGKTNVQAFNGAQEVLTIASPLNRLDKVTGTLNVNFDLFNPNEEVRRIMDKLPPVLVPFGDYKFSPATENILYQKVGSIPTGRPLLAVNLNGKFKSAVFTGEGIWQWRMEEYALTDRQDGIDDLLTKTLQLISLKEDKRKLRVYPVSEAFGVDQKVILENEAYNALFEKVYDVKINLELSGGKQKKVFSYLLTKDNSRFEISNLPPGFYQYKASAMVLGKEETAEGQFLVTETDIETLNSRADFDLLRTLSQQNNGQFVSADHISDLEKAINRENVPDRVISSEELKEMINLKWLLPLILLLITLEWVLRKYLGAY